MNRTDNGITENNPAATLVKIEKDLAKILPERRFRHTQGVRYTAAALAMAYGEDIYKAELAGLLHDCAKYHSDEEFLAIAEENGIEVSEAERIDPQLLHAKCGALFAKECYGVTDEDILSSIRYHTTGHAGMTRLEEIIFTADYIEPGRTHDPDMPRIRQTAFSDLSKAVCIILENTVRYLQSKGRPYDPVTEEARNYYQAM